MSPRSSPGNGSLEERPKGSGNWRLKVRAGHDPATGRAVRRSITFRSKPGNLTEARKRARELLVASGAVTTSITLREAIEEFLSHSEARGRSPETLVEYRRILDRRVGPALGDVALEDLTAHALDGFYRACLQGAKPVSPATVRRYHSVISATLNQAVRWGWVDSNVAQRATLPSPVHKPLVVPTPEEVATILRGCELGAPGFPPHPVLAMFVRLAAVTGARRGELCALTWPDVGEGSVRIRTSVFTVGSETGIKAPKSGLERSVPIGPGTSGDLVAWRRRCSETARAHGVELLEDGYVLSGEVDGSRPWIPDTASSSMRRLCDALGLPHVHVHSLRHFAATQLLAGGIPARDAADVLGHADPALTLRVYAHATPERQRRAAEVLENSLRT